MTVNKKRIIMTNDTNKQMMELESKYFESRFLSILLSIRLHGCFCQSMVKEKQNDLYEWLQIYFDIINSIKC